MAKPVNQPKVPPQTLPMEERAFWSSEVYPGLRRSNMLLYAASHCKTMGSNVLDRYRESAKGLFDREDRLVIDALRSFPGFIGDFSLDYGDGKIGRALKQYTNGGAAKHGKINLRKKTA